MLEAAQRLPVRQPIELVDAIWDTQAGDEQLEALPLPESHRYQFERPLADIEEHPDDEVPWEDVCRG